MTQLDQELITKDFKVIQGNDTDIILTVTKVDSLGVTSNLGAVTDATFKLYNGMGVEVLSLSLGSGISYSAPTFTITLTDTQTAALDSKCKHEMIILDSLGNVSHVLLGETSVIKTKARF